MATTEDGGRENVTAANSGGRRDMETPEFLQLHGEIIQEWFWMDSMVMSWILNAISKKISKAFLYTKSSRQLWLDLEERYGESNGPLVYQLQRAIASIRQGTHTVIEYFNNLTSLWDELDCLKPPSYDSIRNQILVMDPFPSVNKAYAMVLRIERQRMINAQTGENVDNVALHTKWNDSRSNTGSRGVLQNLNKGGYKGKGLIDKRTQICTNCGKTGHTKDTCFKLHGVPDWYRDMKEQRRGETGPARGFNVVSGEGNINTDGSNNFGETMKQMAELMKMMRENMSQQDPLQVNFAHGEDFAGKVISNSSVIDFGSWIVDTGATNHMCAFPSHFTHRRSSTLTSFVHLPDGSSQPVKFTGDIPLTDRLKLTNVLYIPTFKYNLISVQKLCASNAISVHFSPLNCWLQDLETKDILAVGRVLGGLYILDKASFNPTYIQRIPVPFISSKCNMSSTVGDNWLWHQRLGHPSLPVIQHIKSIKAFGSWDMCDICHIAKQKRLPFPSHDIQSTQVFELIHVDVWGPYRTPTLTKCHYFLTIVDDHSRAVWVFLLQNKTQVFSKLSSFLNSVQTQFHTQVKIVRSDNGSEFVNFSCHDLFQSLGIIHQKSCPHTPQQNGIVERKHQHLLNMARSLMHQASLPRYFWGECILTAAYLINRLPSSVLQWKTPYEILYHKPPFLDHLRIFGCLCYATNVLPHKDKFDSRASKCVLVGYSQNQKGYRLFHLTDKVIFTSRDVYFHENYFPFSHITHSPTSYLPTPAIDSTSYTHPNSAPVDSITPNPEPNVPETPTLNLSPAHTPVLRRSQRHVDAVQEPRSFTEANRSSHWREAMEKELEALEKNSTWDLTELPAGKRAIGSRWVYKTKLNQDGSIERYKARLVAKGIHRLKLDVNNAFLHGHLEEEVYMVPPEGYNKAHGGLVCRLKKSLYGLKQASRQWNVEFTTKLESYGFKQCPHDHCLFTLKKDSLFLALIVYVDDVLLTGNSLPALDAVKHYLDDLFTIKDLGNAKYFLGLELARSNQGTYVTQRKYLLDIVHDCHLDDAKATTTPLPAGIKFDASSGPCLASPERYRRLVGRLLYLGFSRPDISFAVQQLSQFIQCPRQPHWDAALYLVRYLKGSSTLGLFFAADSSLPLTAYSDSDWASCLDTRRSVTGYCIFLGASLISWKTKKQATVSRSSAEAEYRSMGSTVCELLWIGYILAEFGISLDSPIPFYCDNKAAIHITENPVFHERTKHLDIDCHLVRDQFKRGFILPQHVSSQHQPADLFTKSLPASPFARLISKLGMLSHAPT
ncbi:UNVERIFIED_CONTAM: Retrovirus-related Pol polyprotein from transposon RE1 [Sesamum radiatum]|uniref:Retrovirus-related Pol polyprotein from transposon RE1 n=1 Tax=Sesamum radiatum TaxID=300843 RepID=A0AAW2RX58_SESRA